MSGRTPRPGWRRSSGSSDGGWPRCLDSKREGKKHSRIEMIVSTMNQINVQNVNVDTWCHQSHTGLCSSSSEPPQKHHNKMLLFGLIPSGCDRFRLTRVKLHQRKREREKHAIIQSCGHQKHEFQQEQIDKKKIKN